jgi:eukaryotic-like serine/threonine-protein kinase
VFLVDVKGEQVLVKLLDFGVAKLNEKDVRAKRVGHTATGTIVGTPQYLSPEQARGQEVDYRADIYALGGIAFELLTGQTPFVADNVMEMVAKHIMEAPVRPSTLARVPPELDDLVVATLAKSSADRPPLSEWLAVLDRVKHEPFERADRVWPIYNTPVLGMVVTPSARQPTPMPSTIEPVALPRAKRKPWLLLTAMAMAMAIATAAVVFTMANKDDGQARSFVLPTLPLPTPAPPTPNVVTPTATQLPVVEATMPAPPKVPSHKTHHNGSAGSGGSGQSAALKPTDDDELLVPGSIPTPVQP